MVWAYVAKSSDWINQCREIVVEGPSRRGRYNSWNSTVKAELRKINFREADVFDRKTWRKRVSSLTIHTPN